MDRDQGGPQWKLKCRRANRIFVRVEGPEHPMRPLGRLKGPAEPLKNCTHFVHFCAILSRLLGPPFAALSAPSPFVRFY